MLKKDTGNPNKRGIIPDGAIFTANMEIFIFSLVMFFKIIIFNKTISVYYTHLMLLVSALGTVLALAGFSLLFKRKTRIKVLLSIDIFLSILMVADMVYFRYFNDVISIPVLQQVVLMDTLKSSIFNLFRVTDLPFIIDIVVFTPAVVWMLRNGKAENRLEIKKRVISSVAVFLAGVCCISYGFMRINQSMGSRIFTFVLDRTYFVQNIGIVNFHGFDIYSTVAKNFSRGERLPEEKKQEIQESFKHIEEDGSKKLSGVAKDLNLIVIQAEAFQNILVDMKINGMEVTPNINKFVRRSAYFNNYFSQAAQGSTSDAEFLSNASLYPLTEGSVYFRYPNNKFDTLPKAMKSLGYKTIAMHAYKGSYWNRAAVYPSIGFDKFANMPDYIFDDRVGWGLSDKSFFKQSVSKLSNEKGLFHSFMISLSAHYPYDAFENSTEFNVEPYEHTFFGNYLKAQHYADEAFGVLFEELEKSGLLDKSIVVIYGDHAGIQKEKTAEYKDFMKLNDNIHLRWLQMTKVPLIIHFPADREAGTRSTAGGQIDLYPTIANLFGLKAEYGLGKDLFNTDDGYAIFRDGTVTDGKYAYIKTANECYDLVSGEKDGMDVLKEKIELGAKQLEISDNMIMHDLIKDFTKKEQK